MPRSIWSGSLSFGLVNVPVRLVSAVRDMDVHFNQIHESTGERIEVQRICEKEGEEVPWEEIAHGYDEGGEQVVVTDSELEAVAPEKTRTIDIERFVDEEEIDPVHFDHPYFLVPDAEGEGPARAYRLLRDVMAAEDRVAIGRVVMRAKEYLVALRERDGALALETMVFADEIRDPGDIAEVPSGRSSAPKKAEVDQMVELVESMTGEFDPGRWEDCHRKRLLDIVAKKRKGGTIEVPEREPEPEAPPDLMAALEASLARTREVAGGKRRSGGGGTSRAKARAKT